MVQVPLTNSYDNAARAHGGPGQCATAALQMQEPYAHGDNKKTHTHTHTKCLIIHVLVARIVEAFGRESERKKALPWYQFENVYMKLNKKVRMGLKS